MKSILQQKSIEDNFEIHPDFFQLEKRSVRFLRGLIAVVIVPTFIFIVAKIIGAGRQFTIELTCFFIVAAFFFIAFAYKIRDEIANAKPWQKNMTCLYENARPINTEVDITPGYQSMPTLVKITLPGEDPIELKAWYIACGARYPYRKQQAVVRINSDRSAAIVEVGDVRFWCGANVKSVAQLTPIQET